MLYTLSCRDLISTMFSVQGKGISSLKYPFKLGMVLTLIIVIVSISFVNSSEDSKIDVSGESSSVSRYLSKISFYEEIARLPDSPQEIFEKYENLLMEERSHHHSITSIERIQDLGNILCTDARNLRDYDNSYLSAEWKYFMSELRETERNETRCANFLYYASFGWLPHVFSWANAIEGNIIAQRILSHVGAPEHHLWVDLLRSSQMYGLTSMGYFTLEKYNFPVGFERTQHLLHLKVLMDSIDKNPSSFDNIIEFGAGTADYLPLLRQARFKGRYFIYDLPEMLLLQQYFLGLSNYPSYIIDSFSDPAHVSQRTTLMSSSLDNLIRHFNFGSSPLPQNDLLIATYSLAESDVVLRNQFITAFSNISYGILAYAGQFDNVNNFHYFTTVLPALLPNHYICQWRQNFLNLPDSYYAVLMRKDLGIGISCKNHISCNRESFVAGDCIFE